MKKILEEFRDDILKNVNAKECAPELRRRHVIAESTETDIERARDARTARGILYDHLLRNCTLEQIVVLSRVLMEVDSGFGKTKEVGQQMYARIQGAGASGTGQNVGQAIGESQLHPSVTEKKPTFAERVIETRITKEGFHGVQWKFTAEAVDVVSGTRAKAKNYKSKGGAKEHARTNLKAILVEQGFIRKD